jgi:hypothetical protein
VCETDQFGNGERNDVLVLTKDGVYWLHEVLADKSVPERFRLAYNRSQRLAKISGLRGGPSATVAKSVVADPSLAKDALLRLEEIRAAVDMNGRVSVEDEKVIKKHFSSGFVFNEYLKLPLSVGFELSNGDDVQRTANNTVATMRKQRDSVVTVSSKILYVNKTAEQLSSMTRLTFSAPSLRLSDNMTVSVPHIVTVRWNDLNGTVHVAKRIFLSGKSSAIFNVPFMEGTDPKTGVRKKTSLGIDVAVFSDVYVLNKLGSITCDDFTAILMAHMEKALTVRTTD